MVPNNDTDIEYLEKTLLRKDAIRIAFEEYLYDIRKLSSKVDEPTCFICFNAKEVDVSKWLENTLVPDLDRIGIKPISCFGDLGYIKKFRVFQDLIRKSNLVIVACTPLLKKKCDSRRNNPTGVAQEIKLVIEHYNYAGNYDTIYPIYLKGDRKSSCPSVFLEPIVGAGVSVLDKSTESSVFTYYTNAFELFGKMCGISDKKSQEIKEQFFSEAKNIIFGNKLDVYKDKIDPWRKKCIDKNKILLKSISDNIIAQAKVIDFPSPPKDFTGRKTELNDLREACKNNNTIVIAGPGGIGKTSLALKYADEYKSHYKFVHFITASSQYSIVQGLIDLSDKMNILFGEIPIRLEKLRDQLHKFDGDYLLIFDGINHPDAFEELKSHLPNDRKCMLLTSRMFEFDTQELHCKSLTLTAWRIEEAANYLRTTTKSEKANQAKILAEKLCCLPLALTQASAYIRNRNCDMYNYVKQFEQYEHKLFEKEYLELEKEEKTILTLLQIALNEIENYHKCYIAKPILYFLSFLNQTPIPLIIVKHWFKTFFRYYSELELGTALGHLYNYSMIDTSPEHCTINLSMQKIIRSQLSSDEYNNNLLQVLDTLNYWIKGYDTHEPTKLHLIRIIVPHCEMLSHYIKKTNERIFDIEKSFTFFKNLGLYFLKEGFFQKSLVYLKYCKKLAKKLYGTNNPNMSKVIYNIGNVLQKQGKLDEAEAQYKKALEIEIKIYGTKNHLKISSKAHQIGVILQKQGKLDEAEAYYRKALKIKTKVYGTKNHPEIAKTIHNIGSVLQDKGKLDEAKALYRESLEIQTKAYGTRSHLFVAKTIHQIGTIMQDQGKFEEAEAYYKEVLEIETKAYGTKYHPEIIKTIHNIGSVMQDRGKLDEAEAYYKEALEIETKLYATSNHTVVSKTIHQIGRVLQKQDKLDEAKSYYKKALEIETKAYGTRNHPEIAKIIHNIGSALQEQGKFDEAEEHYREVLEIQTKIYGIKYHPDMAKTIHNIGIMLHNQNKLDASAAYYKEALEIQTQIYETRYHPDVASTIYSMGMVLYDQGKFNEAEALHREVLEIQTKIYGTKYHLDIASTIYTIGRALEDHGKFDEAEAQYKEALEIQTKVHGTKYHHEVAKTINQIGSVLYYQNKLNEAEAYFREALEIQTKIYGPKDHPSILKTMQKIELMKHEKCYTMKPKKK